MMPIKSGEERIYWKGILDKIIRPAVEASSYGIEVKRVDELPGSGNWLKNIIEYTHEADIVVADLTGMNPNVMWELGMRHACAPHGSIIICQSHKDIPSDLRSYNAFEYAEDGSDLDDFKERIGGCIDEILRGRGKVDSPFFDFIGETAVARREIQVGFMVQDELATETAISIPVRRFEETEPSESAEEILARLSFEGSVWNDPAEVKGYNDELRDVLPEYVAAQKARWQWDSAVHRAVELRPFLANRGSVKVRDVHLRVVIEGDGLVVGDWPPRPRVPELPEKPQEHYPEQLTIGGGGHDIVFPLMQSEGEMAGTHHSGGVPIEAMANLGYNGPLVAGLEVLYVADAVKQDSTESRWRTFHFIPGESFKRGRLVVEIRCDGIRGTIRRVFDIVRAGKHE